MREDERWRRHAEELEGENEDLRVRIDELEELITRGNDKKGDLVDVLGTLKLELEDTRRRREAESHERSQSRAMILDECEECEAVEEDLNAIRNKLAAVQIELQQKEDDLEIEEREIDELVSEHRRIVAEVEDQWRGESRSRRYVMYVPVSFICPFIHISRYPLQALERSEAESKELRMTISEYESDHNDLHDKLEDVFGSYEREGQEKDVEIEVAIREIEKLGQQVYDLEDENERLKDEWARMQEADAAKREEVEGLTEALKGVSLTFSLNHNVNTDVLAESSES